MKKLLLVSLTTMLFAVTAWGTEVVVNNFADLKTALSTSGTADVVKLGQNITYEGSAVLDIQRSLTLDGQGHKIIGFKTTAIMTDGTQPHNTSIAINAGQFGSTAELDVTIKNLSVGNPSTNARYYGIIAFDGVKKLTLDNVKIETGDYGVQQGLCFTGTSATPIQLSIANSYINVGKSAYSVYILKPVVGTVSNSTIEGWCGLYFKYRATPMYGEVVGSRGSNITCENCNFVCPNIHYGKSNGFAIFPIEDDGITLKLVNCGLNKDQMSDEWQGVFSIQYRTRTEGYQPINIEVSGDNTYVFNATLNDGDDAFVAVEDNWWNGYGSGYEGATVTSAGAIDIDDTPITIAFKGGTYSVNPDNAYFTNGKGGQSKVTIPDGYEVKEITTTQEGETTTLYRVREEIIGSTALNDNAGQNPTEDIKVTSDVELANDNTKAEFIEVKGGEGSAPAETVTVTVPEDKTLTISNGLDVTGNAEVVVKSGSTVAVSKGGVIAEKASNIVIEADENGAASFLLSPEVIVNTTPVITVKMTTKVGTIDEAEDDRTWHRFAAPVAHIKSFSKDVADAGTWIFGWNYGTNSWQQISQISDMTPFHGYTLSHTKPDPTTVVYTFTGELAGNTDNMLQFSSRGYNYFGNSYSGYIDIRQLLNKLDLDAIDASVWMWDQENGVFRGVPINTLKDDPSAFSDEKWKTEVAPMQTFILRWMNGSESPDGEISYSEAIWGNPRYSSITGVVPAPKRVKAEQDNAFVRVNITSANGKKDYIDFREADRFNDTYESGYDVSKYINENALNIYSTVSGEDCETVATDNLVGKTISLQTLNEINYTLSFARVSGATYAIKDMQTGVVTLMSDENTYEFTAQPNATTEGRFMIVEVNKVPTTIDNVSITPAAKGIYTLLGQFIGESDMWNTLPLGVYVVDGVKLVK